MQGLKQALLAVFPRRRAQFLWYLREIRGKLNLNRAMVRFIHKVPKE
jgi:hypothetical protein